MTSCKNCNIEIIQNYCSNCGQPAKLKRIDAHYIVHEIEHVLHFDKGILFTIRELLIRPGQNIREFISDNRNRLVKPIIFIVVTSLIYTLINQFFHIEDGYVKFEEAKKTSLTLIFEWIQNHYGYANIIMSLFIAFWLRLFFRKKGYNFFEISILLCFVMGIGMLIISVFAIAEGLTKVSLMQISGVLIFIYCCWAIGQFFDGNKFSSYIKAMAAYLLGMFTFLIWAIFLGFLLETIIK